MTDHSWKVYWCFFRNSLHSAYREIRYLGPARDPDANATAGKEYASQMDKCRANRKTLKSTVPYRVVKHPSTSEYIHAYQALTGLRLEDLLTLFATAKWRPGYGGRKWAAITDLVIQLRAAIDSADSEACEGLCHRIRKIYHNSGPLVPTRAKWGHDRWQQEKWPELCDPD